MKCVRYGVLMSVSIWLATLSNGQPVFFTHCTYDTGNNATLLIPLTATLELDGLPLAPGSEVAAFTPDSICAGVAVWDGQQPLVLTLWGDDPWITPETKEGFSPGDTIRLAVWDKATQRYLHAANGRFTVRYASGELLTDNGRYWPDALYRIEQLQIRPIEITPVAPTAELPEALHFSAPYPNPFHTHTTFVFELPQALPVRLIVYTLTGQEVVRLANKVLPAGKHRLVWQPEQLSGGFYVARLETPVAVVERSVVYLP